MIKSILKYIKMHIKLHSVYDIRNLSEDEFHAIIKALNAYRSTCSCVYEDKKIIASMLQRIYLENPDVLEWYIKGVAKEIAIKLDDRI